MLRNFISDQSLEVLLAQQDALAVLRFENADLNAAANEQGSPSIRVQQLCEQPCDKNLFEVWQLTGQQIETGQAEMVTWRRSSDLQFASITVELDADGDFEASAKTAYTQLLNYIERSEHPQLVRFWNYLPHINHGDGDRENYKTFCTGRLLAFESFELDVRQFPAASAVGHYRNGLTVCALTAKSMPDHHANPRQVDAFKYPRQYGASSPSFARATTLNIADKRLCFISGTASILGHSSVHKDDLRLQLYTTNDNILYLLKETEFTRKQIQALRVYVRHANDYTECKAIIEELYPDTPAIYTHADICRAELLVEVECFCVADA